MWPGQGPEQPKAPDSSTLPCVLALVGETPCLLPDLPVTLMSARLLKGCPCPTVVLLGSLLFVANENANILYLKHAGDKDVNVLIHI